MPLTNIALGNITALSGCRCSFGLNDDMWHTPAIFTTTSFEFAHPVGIGPTDLSAQFWRLLTSPMDADVFRLLYQHIDANHHILFVSISPKSALLHWL